MALTTRKKVNACYVHKAEGSSLSFTIFICCIHVSRELPCQEMSEWNLR